MTVWVQSYLLPSRCQPPGCCGQCSACRCPVTVLASWVPHTLLSIIISLNSHRFPRYFLNSVPALSISFYQFRQVKTSARGHTVSQQVEKPGPQTSPELDCFQGFCSTRSAKWAPMPGRQWDWPGRPRGTLCPEGVRARLPSPEHKDLSITKAKIFLCLSDIL